jgi:hypothetical protein
MCEFLQPSYRLFYENLREEEVKKGKKVMKRMISEQCTIE